MPVYDLAQAEDMADVRLFLEKDRDYAAYALSDLEAPYAAKSTWYAAKLDGKLEGLALIYEGLDPPALFLMGSNPAVSAMLMHSVGPDTVYFNARPEYMPLLETWYTVEKATTMSRMRLSESKFNPLAETRFPVHKLDASNLTDLNALYKLDEKDGESVVAFSPDMVKDGYFYGVRVDENLIAAAGTHVVAMKAGIAALGNVYTHMDFRNKGLGGAVSSAVVAALFEAGLETLVLNVAQDNDHAIKMYKRLGFEQAGPFVEGPARRQ